jgi:hypothetical protein
MRVTECHSSPANRHLRRLFPDLSRVDDEFERIRILVLLHQLEVHEPFRIRHGRAALKPASGRFQQGSSEFIFTVGRQAFHCFDDLSFRQTEVVNQEFCMIGPAEVVEALQVWLPIPDVLVVKPVNDVFAQNQVWLIHVGLVSEQARGNQVRLVNRGTLITPARRS